MGNFNAKIEKKTKTKTNKNLRGPFVTGQRNDRRKIDVIWCIENKLTITNTIFGQEHPRRLYIWTLPDANIRNQIDYI